MAKVTISGKEFNMRFNLAFWEAVKDKVDVTQANLEQKLNENFPLVASTIVFYGIYYGLPSNSRPDDISKVGVTLEQLKDELDASVADAIEETIIEGMTKVQKQLVEKAREAQKKQIDNIGDNYSKKK